MPPRACARRRAPRVRRPPPPPEGAGEALPRRARGDPRAGEGEPRSRARPPPDPHRQRLPPPRAGPRRRSSPRHPSRARDRADHAPHARPGPDPGPDPGHDPGRPPERVAEVAPYAPATDAPKTTRSQFSSDPGIRASDPGSSRSSIHDGAPLEATSAQHGPAPFPQRFRRLRARGARRVHGVRLDAPGARPG